MADLCTNLNDIFIEIYISFDIPCTIKMISCRDEIVIDHNSRMRDIIANYVIFVLMGYDHVYLKQYSKSDICVNHMPIKYVMASMNLCDKELYLYDSMIYNGAEFIGLYPIAKYLNFSKYMQCINGYKIYIVPLDFNQKIKVIADFCYFYDF